MKYCMAALVVLIGVTNASADECKHRILFVPQTHASVLGGSLQVTPEWFEQTAKSQFTIAQYLAKHKDLPVFSEQISSDKSMVTVSDEFKKIIPPTVKNLFPNGLPANYSDLSIDQKTFLAKAGGDLLSLVQGQTPMLRRVVENDQIEDDLIGRVSTWVQQHPNATEYPPEISDLIFNARENLALDQVNTYFSSNPSQRDIVLIFGSDHGVSFHAHADKFPPQCILTPFEFQSVKDSPYGRANSDSDPYRQYQAPATR